MHSISPIKAQKQGKMGLYSLPYRTDNNNIIIILIFKYLYTHTALIVGQSWKSNMDGLYRVMTITAVNYVEGTFAGRYGIMNSDMDELRGTFDKDGGNLVGWTLSYRNGYLYGTQVWSGHFVNYQGTDQLAIESLSLRTGPGYTPSNIVSEYFVQANEGHYDDAFPDIKRVNFKTSGN